MPLYRYRCKNCEHEFEVRQRFSDDPIKECIRCEGTVRRVISQVGVVFKGSGFYVTDNRNGRSNGSLTSKANTGESSSEKSEPKEEKAKSAPDAKSGKDGSKNLASSTEA